MLTSAESCMHDAAVSSMTFANLPLVRLSCNRGLVALSYQGPCLHPDCKLPGCEGNRLYIMQQSPLLMRIKLPHHKNAHNWGQACIEFDLPAELAELLHTCLAAPSRALLDYNLLADRSGPFAFMLMHGRVANFVRFPEQNHILNKLDETACLV